jgi:hypothetical protein
MVVGFGAPPAHRFEETVSVALTAIESCGPRPAPPDRATSQ